MNKPLSEQCPGSFPHAYRADLCMICNEESDRVTIIDVSTISTNALNLSKIWNFIDRLKKLMPKILGLGCGITILLSQPVSAQQTQFRVQLTSRGSADRVLSWEQFHFNVASAIAPRLRTAFNSSNWPSGNIIVELSVTPEHHIKARVISAENVQQARAVECAYNGLDGSSALTYPEGSQRGLYIYTVNPCASTASDPDWVHGDLERQHFSF